MIALAELQGHWRRNWLRAPGIDDAATRVHWLQAGPWCADIRVPLLRPGLDAGSLDAMTPADLAALLAAEGFAGRVTLGGTLCTWHRDWNWQGYPCPVDAGTLRFDPTGRLIEDGAEADYREEWERVPCATFAAEAVTTDGADGLLLGNGGSFLLALGRRGAPSWPALAEALREGRAAPAEAAPAFASVYVLGHWDDGTGIADLSTQPFCEGQPVLAREGAAARLVLPDFHGREIARTLRLASLPDEAAA